MGYVGTGDGKRVAFIIDSSLFDKKKVTINALKKSADKKFG